VVRYGAGREQVTRFDYFYDPIDLDAGEEEYTLAAGVVATELGLQPSYSDDPVVIANYRKALSDTLILGGGLQLARDVQLASFEAQVVPQVVPGSFDFQGALSTGNGLGFAARGGYRLVLGSGLDTKRISVAFDYESDRFTTTGDLARFNLSRLSLSAIFSQAMTERTSMVAGANYFSSSGSPARSTLFTDVTHRVRDNIRASLGVEYSTGDSRQNFGIRAGISVLFGQRHRADATYQSRQNQLRASVSRGSDNTIGSLGYTFNVQKTDGSALVDGVADYIGNRFDARASVGTAGTSLGGITDQQTARLQIGTSVAFADGAFGIGRPIQDSFLLAQPHSSLEDVEVIAGRSLSGGDYEAASGLLGDAVVGRLSSYTTQEIRYDIDTLDAGYDIGSGVARVKPPLHSGYALTVGDERFVSAVGFLFIEGAPAKLAVGLITSDDDEGFEPEPFFTNSAGRFGIIGLAPGRSYNIRLDEYGQTFSIEVPEDTTGLYRLGTVELASSAE